MYPNLKLEIFKLGIHQNHLAREVGIGETILSKIIHCYREPSEAERAKLATYLNADPAWLFQRYEGGRPAHNPGAPAVETPLERKDGQS